MNSMQELRIEKVTLNIGVGKSQDRLEKALTLLKLLTGREPVKNITQKRIQSWGIRPGLPVGCKVTIRKDLAAEVLKRLIEAKDMQLKEGHFDKGGNVCFGLAEYIDIPGMKYNPDIGSMGFQVCVSLTRPGLRITTRKIKQNKIPMHHRVSREDALAFMEKKFGVKVGGEE